MSKIYNNNSESSSLYNNSIFRLFINTILWVGPLKYYHKKPNTFNTIILPGVISLIAINFILNYHLKFYFNGKTKYVSCSRNNCDKPLFINKKDLIKNIRFHINGIYKLRYGNSLTNLTDIKTNVIDITENDIILVKPKYNKSKKQNNDIDILDIESKDIESTDIESTDLNTPIIRNSNDNDIIWESTDIIQINNNGKKIITFYNGNNPKKLSNFYTYIFICFIFIYLNIGFIYNQSYLMLNKSKLIQDRFVYRMF